MCFDQYPYAGAAHAGFCERYMRGEKLQAGWVSETDFEKLPPRQNRTPNTP